MVVFNGSPKEEKPKEPVPTPNEIGLVSEQDSFELRYFYKAGNDKKGSVYQHNLETGEA